MKLWSTNMLMRAVNLWREGLSLKEIAAALDRPEREIKEHFEEMRRMGLEKL